MSNSPFQRMLLITAACILTSQPAPAITADALAKALGRGEPIKLLDLRPQLRFEAGSIPGAMNIPASVILEKQLPPLAHAVLFDDGLGTIDVWAIAATLNQRPGWKADVLTGGYAAWHALQNAPDTAASGLHLERTQQIGYDNLNQLTEPVVLLDMRPAPTKVAASVQTTAASASDPLRDFCGKKGNRSYCANLPELRKRHQPPHQQTTSGANLPTVKSAAPSPLIVLVHAVNADTLETCRRLRAEGYTRVVVLTGGDEAIQLEGRRGKGRVAGVVGQGDLSTPPVHQIPAAQP